MGKTLDFIFNSQPNLKVADLSYINHDTFVGCNFYLYK